MSKELPSNKNTKEEVDLIVFFNLLGNVINKVYAFILSILKALFSSIIYIIKALINGWKIILGILIITATIGYFVERVKPDVYYSEMLVEPYFDSKYQLVTNINYFNALISDKDYKTLEEIFNKEKKSNLDVKDIQGFKVEPGPETENDRILQYQSFMKRLDSVRKEEISFEEYIKNRSIYSGNLFLITAYSGKRDIFKKLEKGVSTAFVNEFSDEEFKKKQQLREIQKENLLTKLKEIDSLKSFYIKVRIDESQNTSKQIKLGDISLSNASRSTTREYELLEKENKIRDALNALEEQKIQKNKVYDVISSFQGVGNVRSSIFEKYSIIFPCLAFVFLCLFYLAKKIIIFSKNYEA